MLAVARATNEDADAFREIFAEVHRRLEKVHEKNHPLWSDLLRIIFTWAVWRRPGSEQEQLIETAAGIHSQEQLQREVRDMGHKLGPTLYEEGLEQGREQGRLEKLEKCRQHILLLGRKNLGEMSEELQARLNQITDEAELDRLLLRVTEISDWNQLFVPI